MKEFNLEEAKAGKPVCMRNGLKARIICFDRKGSIYPIIALVEGFEGFENIYNFTEDGKCVGNRDGDDEDLMMTSEKHEGWINVYKTDNTFITDCHIYKTKEKAGLSIDSNDITTIKIEWEE